MVTLPVVVAMVNHQYSCAWNWYSALEVLTGWTPTERTCIAPMLSPFIAILSVSWRCLFSELNCIMYRTRAPFLTASSNAAFEPVDFVPLCLFKDFNPVPGVNKPSGSLVWRYSTFGIECFASFPLRLTRTITLFLFTLVFLDEGNKTI